MGEIANSHEKLENRRGRLLLVTLALLAGSVPFGAPAAQAADAPPGARPAPTRISAVDPAQKSGAEVALLMIPAIGLTETVRSGIAMNVINQGPAHWAGTSLPGGPGNVVLAGHRTTKTKPFHNLDRLDPGDLIFFSDRVSYLAIYRVTETLIVNPVDLWITYDTGEPIVTLFACHPKGSARKRIVVRGELVAKMPLRSLQY